MLKAREEQYSKEYRTNLARRIKLNNEAKDKLDHISIPKITPSTVPQFNSAEEEFANTDKQREIALSNLRAVLKYAGDASEVVNKLSTNTFPGSTFSELMIFNRYWPSFEKYVISNIGKTGATPNFILKLWQQYKAVAAYYESNKDLVDFVSPVDRIEAERYIDNTGKLLKEKIKEEGDLMKAHTLSLAIDRAVIEKNLPALDDIAKKLGDESVSSSISYLIPKAPTPLQPLTTVKKPEKSISKVADFASFNKVTPPSGAPDLSLFKVKKEPPQSPPPLSPSLPPPIPLPPSLPPSLSSTTPSLSSTTPSLSLTTAKKSTIKDLTTKIITGFEDIFESKFDGGNPFEFLITSYNNISGTDRTDVNKKLNKLVLSIFDDPNNASALNSKTGDGNRQLIIAVLVIITQTPKDYNDLHHLLNFVTVNGPFTYNNLETAIIELAQNRIGKGLLRCRQRQRRRRYRRSEKIMLGEIAAGNDSKLIYKRLGKK